jgi:hypothetical protein
MKEITECSGVIGQGNSTIFSKLDFTSGFWQMQLMRNCKHLQPSPFQPRPISMDHFTDGSSALPHQFSVTHGKCAEKHFKHHHVH